MSNERRRKTVTAIAVLGAIAAAGAVGGVLSSQKLYATTALTAPHVPQSQSLPGSFAPIIQKVGPAVVSIRVTGHMPVAESEQQQIPEPFRRFFGGSNGFQKFFGFEMPGNNGQPQPHQRAPRVEGLGSGFFIDASGDVVTNNHVVEGADKIEVVTRDGDTYKAELVGRDPKTDLALIKVKSDKAFPYVKLGNSSTAKVGDWVVAMGSPFGLGHTATAGIVSARGRDIGAGPYDDFLQIDAPINKGNSGGPTFNMQGEVIGVNTAIISPSGTSAGIGFAIPSNMVKNVVAQLKATGKVARGWLGVHIQAVTKDLAESIGMDHAEGAIIASVTQDSPAAKAGLKQGDVIVKVDGTEIKKLHELPRLIAGIPAGKVAKVTVLRNGDQKTVDVRIGKMPSNEKLASAKSSAESKTAHLGMQLATIDNSLRSRFQIPESANGVLVTNVDQDSVAADKGIRPGDIISQVSGHKVDEPAQVAKAVENASDHHKKAVLMLIRRNGNDLYVALPLRNA